MAQLFGYASFGFAWTLNFLLMAWFTLLVNQLKPNLDSSFFLPKPFEMEGKLYRYAGINVYRKLLVWTGWEKITRKGNAIQANVASLRTLEYNSRVSETGHLLIFLIVLTVSLMAVATVREAKWLWLTNILFNVYPAFLQRFNRPRYLRLLRYFKQVTASTEKPGARMHSNDFHLLP
ncbi:glycosyl-4,4'-diaponeurosporenoate acyltransferase CrtO family protein [Rufibacter immobilis]|nr:hypothetical protein [Rufibacter immobilis]